MSEYFESCIVMKEKITEIVEKNQNNLREKLLTKQSQFTNVEGNNNPNLDFLNACEEEFTAVRNDIKLLSEIASKPSIIKMMLLIKSQKPKGIGIKIMINFQLKMKKIRVSENLMTPFKYFKK